MRGLLLTCLFALVAAFALSAGAQSLSESTAKSMAGSLTGYGASAGGSQTVESGGGGTSAAVISMELTIVSMEGTNVSMEL